MATVVESEPMAEKSPVVRPVSRLVRLDFARLIAAYAIVWLHTPRSAQLIPWNVLGRFAVPFFTAGAVFFVIDGLRRKSQSLGEYTINRFRRIYLPFLAWSVIYLLVKLVKKSALPDEANDFPGIEVLWAGTFWHLWFMPFILLVTLGTFVLCRPVVGHAQLEWAVCVASLVIGAVIACAEPPAWVAQDTTFCSMAWNALPGAFWGLSMALAYPGRLKLVVDSRITSIIAGCVFLALMAYLCQFGRNMLVENLAGMMFLIAALRPKAPQWVEPLAKFGVVAFGIYLAHPLLIKTCEAVATKLHWPISWPLDVTIFAIAAVGSTWLAWELARHRRTRWLAA
jgi:surface polysaccharide O-acyltransferase-like enzyme